MQLQSRLLAALVTVALLSLPAVVVAPPSSAAAPAVVSTADDVNLLQCPTADPCLSPQAWAGKKFRKGRFGDARHATPARTFETPKLMFKRFAKKYRAKVAAARPAMAAARPGARAVWNRLFSSSGCWKDTDYDPYEGSSENCPYQFSYNQPPIPNPNWDNVKVGIKLSLCFGGVAAAFVPSAGTSITLLLGAANCSWSLVD